MKLKELKELVDKYSEQGLGESEILVFDTADHVWNPVTDITYGEPGEAIMLYSEGGDEEMY